MRASLPGTGHPALLSQDQERRSKARKARLTGNPQGRGVLSPTENRAWGSTPGAAPGCLLLPNSPRLFCSPALLWAGLRPQQASAHPVPSPLTSTPTPNPGNTLCTSKCSPQALAGLHPALLSLGPFSGQGAVLMFMPFTMRLGTWDGGTHLNLAPEPKKSDLTDHRKYHGMLYPELGTYEGPKSKQGRSSDPDTDGVALPEGRRCGRSLSGHTENCARSSLEADKSGFESQRSVMTSEPQFPQLWLACKLTHAVLTC